MPEGIPKVVSRLIVMVECAIFMLARKSGIDLMFGTVRKDLDADDAALTAADVERDACLRMYVLPVPRHMLDTNRIVKKGFLHKTSPIGVMSANVASSGVEPLDPNGGAKVEVFLCHCRHILCYNCAICAKVVLLCATQYFKREKNKKNTSLKVYLYTVQSKNPPRQPTDK